MLDGRISKLLSSLQFSQFFANFMTVQWIEEKWTL